MPPLHAVVDGSFERLIHCDGQIIFQKGVLPLITFEMCSISGDLCCGAGWLLPAETLKTI